MKDNLNKKRFLEIISFIIIFVFVMTGFISLVFLNVGHKEPEEKQWIRRTTQMDEFGYGETNIGTSGLYVYDTRTLLNDAGYIQSYEDVKTQWEVTIVVDNIQQTEYLIFKDTTTGNIAAVERRKFEEEVPEDEKMYLEDWDN